MTIDNNINFHKAPSLAEWLKKIDSPNAEEFALEDNTKYARLIFLNEEIGLPCIKPITLPAQELVEKKNSALSMLSPNELDKHWALRLVPLNSRLPKIRERDRTLTQYIEEWLPKLNFDPKNYQAELIPQSRDTLYSSLFIVNDDGVWGDIINGIHWQLTQGVYQKNPATFYSNFGDFFYFNNSGTDVELYNNLIRLCLEFLTVPQSHKRELLKKELNAEFTERNILKGYFEFIVDNSNQLLFNDYNRIIYKKMRPFKAQTNRFFTGLRGITASSGSAKGKVVIVNDPQKATIIEGDVVVCHNMTLEYLSLIKDASAVIAEEGNMLSHTAIVCRELGKPFLIGVKDATKMLRDGEKVVVDGENGAVRLL